MATEDKIITLEANVERLIEVCNIQKLDNIRLTAALKAEKAANEKLLKKTTELEAQLNSVSIANALVDSSLTPKVARTRVNNLVKTIDQCITLLNK